MNARIRRFASAGGCLLLLGLARGLHASAPAQLTYQGRLKESGLPVTGSRSVDIQICDSASGGNCYDSGAQSVSVVNGLFRALFSVPTGVVLETGNWYLEVRVGGQIFTPRELLTSNAYAVYSSSASTLIASPGASYVQISTAVSVQGQDSSGYSLVLSSGISTPAGTVAAKYFVGNGAGLTNLPPSPALDNSKVPLAGGTMSGALNMNNVAINLTGASGVIVGASSVAASAFFGDGSHLSNIVASGAVSKLGDGMTGSLTLMGSSLTVTGAGPYSVMTSSGISVVAGGVTAPFFSGSLLANGAGQFIATLSSVNASAFFGDGSHLSGIPSTGSILLNGAAAGGVLSGAYPNPLLGASVVLSSHIANGVIADAKVSLSTAAIATGKFGDTQVAISSAALGASVVQVANGGTGAGAGPAARSNLGAAASGANADIGSLAGAGAGITASTNVVVVASMSVLGLGGLSVPASSVTALSFYGDGSHLSGISGAASFVAASLTGTGASTTPLAVNSSSVAVLNASGLVLNSQIDSSSVTKQGNTFNGPAQLVQLSPAGGLSLPSNGSFLLSGVNGFLTAASSVSASAFFGDGSHLTGVFTSSVGATGVARGAYGSATTAPMFTVFDDGRLTAAGSVSIALPGSAVDFSTITAAYSVKASSGRNTDITQLDSLATLTLTGSGASPTYGAYSSGHLFEFYGAGDAYFGGRAGVGGMGAGKLSVEGSGASDALFVSAATGLAPQLVVSNAGNVGVSTGNPVLPLDVNGAAQFGAGATRSTFTANGSLTLASGANLTVSGPAGYIVSAGSITASSFYGDGSHLNGISGAASFVAASLTGTGASATPLAVNPSSVAVLNASGLVLNSQIDASSVTKQGNIFNGPGQLAQLSGTGGLALPSNGSFLLSGANGLLTTASSVTASAFFGDGSHLTGIPSTGSMILNGAAAGGVLLGAYPNPLFGPGVVLSSHIANGAIGDAKVLLSTAAIATGKFGDTQVAISSAALGASVVPVANGGTGFNSASGARIGLGAAASGVNADIGSLAGAGAGVTFSTNVVVVASMTVSGLGGLLVPASSVTALSFYGDGSHLSGIAGTPSFVTAALTGSGASGAPLGVNSSSVAVLNASGFVLNSQIDASSVTKQGNIFNGPGQLAQLSGTGGLALPFNGSLSLSGSNGLLTTASSVTASAFFGDGSHLTGIPSTGSIAGFYVQKTGDTMTGQLTLSGSTLTVQGSGFSVGPNLFTVASGGVGIGTGSPLSKLEVDSSDMRLVGNDATLIITNNVFTHTWSLGARNNWNGGFQITDGVGRLNIDTSGNTSIGVGAVVSTFTSTGDIRAAAGVYGGSGTFSQLSASTASVSYTLSVGGRIGVSTQSPSYDVSLGVGDKVIGMEDSAASVSGSTLTLRAGSNTSAAGDGGALRLKAGSAGTAGNGGSIILEPGAGSSSFGSVVVGGNGIGAAHLKIYQNASPTTSSTLCLNTPTLNAGATDSSGIVSASAGATAPCVNATIIVNFAKPYTNTNPLKILISPANSGAAGASAYVSPSLNNSGNFSITIPNVTAASTYTFTYLVIE